MIKQNKKNRRICMFLHSVYHIDARVRREAEALFEAGFFVDIVCTYGQKSDKNQLKLINKKDIGFKIHILPIKKKRGRFLRYLFEFTIVTLLGIVKIAILHFKNKYDIIHIHNMPDILVLAGLIPKLTGAKLILDVHDPMVEHFIATYQINKSHWIALLLSAQEKFSYFFPDKVVTVSNTMGELLQSKGIKKDKIFILHNFPDRKIFPLTTINDKLNITKDDFTILYCGTITQHYRLDIAVRALKDISEKIPGIKLKIIGTGNLKFKICELAKSLGIEKQVEIINSVPQEKVKDIMANTDVGISTHQGGIFGDLYFSTKILEFMTQGVSVVSSRTKTIYKYIPDNAIFYFLPEDVDDLVKQLENVWKNNKLVKFKTKKAIELARKYNWDSEKKRLVNFYLNITDQSYEKCSQ